MGQGFAHTIACDAAADGEQALHQSVHLITDGIEVGSWGVDIDHGWV